MGEERRGSPATVILVADVAYSDRPGQLSAGFLLCLPPDKSDSGKQNSQSKDERKSREPGSPQHQSLLQLTSALGRKSENSPDAWPDDEIVGQRQQKKDRHEPQLGCQDRRPSRWVCNREPPLMQQQRACEEENGNRAPHYRAKSTSGGPKEQ